MSALWVLPSIDDDWRRKCLGTLGAVRGGVLVVDNSVENRGVAAAWNVGARAAFASQADHLIVLSESVRFGPGAAESFAEKVSATTSTIVTSPCIGVHLVAFRVDALKVVGPFDEGFWPAYCEDADWLHRAELLGLLSGTRITDVDAWDAAVAHSIVSGRVRVNFRAQEQRYAEKWGGPRYSERFERPWNDPAKGVDWPGW